MYCQLKTHSKQAEVCWSTFCNERFNQHTTDHLLAALMVAIWGMGPTATVCTPLLYRVRALSVKTNDARLGGCTNVHDKQVDVNE